MFDRLRSDPKFLRDGCPKSCLKPSIENQKPKWVIPRLEIHLSRLGHPMRWSLKPIRPIPSPVHLEILDSRVPAAGGFIKARFSQHWRGEATGGACVAPLGPTDCCYAIEPLIWYLNGTFPIKQPRGLLIQVWHYQLPLGSSLGSVCDEKTVIKRISIHWTPLFQSESSHKTQSSDAMSIFKFSLSVSKFRTRSIGVECREL